MLTWMGADPPGPGLHEEFGRILDLCPGVGSLTVQTAKGPILATRDVPGNTGQDVDEALTRLFQANPEVAGVVFPATPTRPAHTATPDNPHWSPPGKAAEDVETALAAGTATPG